MPRPPRLTFTRRELMTVGLVSLLFTLMALAAYDTLSSDWLAHNDFCALFYTAGTMLREGHGNALYLPAGSHSFAHTPFDLCAHRLFPELSARTEAIFLYPPPVSFVFVPFSCLPSRASLIAWQLTLLAAIAFTALIFAGSIRGSRLPFLSLFTLVPVLHSLLLGQPTVLFALLPLVSGYVLWKRNRYGAAGLLWSVLWLKAQILLPLATVLAGWAVAMIKLQAGGGQRARLWDCAWMAGGLASGTAILWISSVFVCGPGSVTGWLALLHEFSEQYFSKAADFSYLHAGSLPAAATVLVSPGSLSTYALVIKPLIAAAFAALFLISYRLMNSALSDGPKRDLALVLCIGALPVLSPYFRTYDLLLLVVVLWIALENPVESRVKQRIKELLLFSWVGLGLFFFTGSWLPGSGYVLLALLFGISVLYIRLCLEVHRLAAPPVKA